MDIKRVTLISGCAMAMLALAGCKREASGQVAAVVNDEEITLQDVNQELGQAELPQGADRKALQQAALQRIIDRRLVAQAAREDGIDKEPEFLARQRQMNELLLIQMFGQKQGRTMRVPDAAALDKFMAAHPANFAERTVYLLDRLQFKMPADPQKLKALEADHTMDAVVVRLNGLGIPFQRGDTAMDSAKLPEAAMARIKSLPAGEPFLLPEGGMVSVAVIKASKPAPITGEQARPIALQAIRNEELAKLLDQRLKNAKTTAKIDYQPGFAPAKPAAPAPAAK